MDETTKKKILKALLDKGGEMAWFDLVSKISESTGSIATAHVLIQELADAGTIEIDKTIIRLTKA